ncbi:MAG TPA: 6-phosphogluconolactonase [Rhodanobacteraceae bacterium]|nr:6-phosphogluconolactonase [Rhodanobacteraceae bacterium]
MTNATTRWHAIDDPRDLARHACARVLAAAGEAIAERGRFDIVLAGGGTPRRTYALLAAALARWESWHVWFGDERCLPTGDAERNSHMARITWLDQVRIPASQIHPIPAERGAVAAAAAYGDALAGLGEFDLVLLGLGEDGHTASLFPGQDWGTQADAADALAVFNAPKPPPERVSISAARLARARQVLFLVEGAGKREAVARWRRGEAIPAAAVMPAAGVDVMVDQALLVPVD